MSSSASPAPPTPPSPPHNLRVGGIFSSSFLALWDIPVSNGNLPLQNYTIEIRRLGNPLCRPMELEWSSAVLGLRHGVTSATVGSLFPYTQYQFRMIAFSSVFRSPPSPESDMLWTSQTGTCCGVCVCVCVCVCNDSKCYRPYPMTVCSSLQALPTVSVQ